jgi:hypothetical protein
MHTRSGRAPILVVLVSAVLLAAVAAPAAADPGGTTRPLHGEGVITTVFDNSTFPVFEGTITGSSQVTHLGVTTIDLDTTITFTAFTQADQTATGTWTASDGSMLFVDGTGTITVTGTTSVSTSVSTITGGTGRFEDATGTFTTEASGERVSLVGNIATHVHSFTLDGKITY